MRFYLDYADISAVLNNSKPYVPIQIEIVPKDFLLCETEHPVRPEDRLVRYMLSEQFS